MRLGAKPASILLMLSIVSPAAVAEKKADPSSASYGASDQPSSSGETLNGVQPLTRAEGATILRVAFQSTRHRDHRLDCSHFVHDLYERSGFPYQYASSSDLYAGIEEFERVRTPQAGDLAVWRGHVGIVVDPAQKSFYSVLHSGPDLNYYDSPYWKRRGTPRFFRYVEAASEPVRHNDISNTIRVARLNSAVSTSAHVNSKSDTNAHPQNSAREVEVDDRLPEIAQQSNERESSAAAAENRATRVAPEILIVNSRPKIEQITAAFLNATADSESRLRNLDIVNPEVAPESVIVFGNFQIAKLHVSGSQGWVDVHIDEVLTISNGEVNRHRGTERQRWFLAREKKQWVLTPAVNAIYLPQSSAERIFSHQLAQLTEEKRNNRNSEKAQLAQVLSILFETH
jgi:hypothetical protein